jgi:plastocyanin
MAAELAALQSEVSGLNARLRRYETRLVRLPPTLDQPADLPEPVSPNPIEPPPLPNLTDGAAPPPHAAAGDGYGYEGLQFGFWGWVTYMATPQENESTFWAWEAELDITKSFSDEIAGSADIDFVDTNHGAWANIEQLFLSFLFPSLDDAILTAGKFNAPFGIERRDFWDRLTGSPTLLFRAQPRDLTGVMFTQPWNAAHLTFRTFVVNGFDWNLDNNAQPSLGLMVEYKPGECLCLAVTNYWGPEFDGNTTDKLYFVEPQASWRITPKLLVEGEYLYGNTESPSGRLSWSGYALIVSHNLNDSWRLFAQWSELDDEDGYITGDVQHQQEINAGLAWYPHPHVEGRIEYRHDIGREWYGSDREVEETFAASAANQDLSRAVIYLDAHPELISEPPAEGQRPQIAQQGKAFVPDLLVVTRGTTVEFPNWDPFSHNVFSRSRAASFDLDRYPQGQSKSYQFKEVGVVQVFCNIHPQMRAVLVVVPNECVTRADAQGRFVLANVPPGRHVLVAWHERGGEQRQTIDVPDGGLRDVVVTLSGETTRERAEPRAQRSNRSGVERGLGVKRERLNLPTVNDTHPAPSGRPRR